MSPVARLADRIATDWRTTLGDNEWCFLRVRESVSELSPAPAFNQIPDCVTLLFQQDVGPDRATVLNRSRSTDV